MLEIQLLKEKLKLRTLKEEKSNLYPQGYSEAKRSETCSDCLNWIIRHLPSIAVIKLALSDGKNMLVYTYEIDFLYKSFKPHS